MTEMLQLPLNAILGTDANIRLLRELCLRPGRFATPGELARRTGLSRAAVYRSLERMTEVGIIENDPSAGQTRCALRGAHPLADALTDLFQSEAERAAAMVAAVRSAAEGLSPPPISVWIAGAGVRGQDGAVEPIAVGLLDTPAAVAANAERLRERLAEVGREQDHEFQVRARTRADLDALTAADREELQDALLVFGAPVDVFVAPERYRQAKPPRTHEDLEARGLAFAAAIAPRLRREPALIERAREWVADRLAGAAESELSDLREWDRLLRSMSPARLSRFLVDSSERAVRLRQSNPFVDAIGVDERLDILQNLSR